MRVTALALFAFLAMPSIAAASEGAGHSNIDLPLALAIVVGAGLLGSIGAMWIKQSTALGQILAGVFVGNFVAFAVENPVIHGFGTVGSWVLLFMAGLETSPDKMKKVGLSAFSVASTGVLVPMVLGTLATYFMYRGAGWPLVKCIFVGAVLTATSVGITAKVLGDARQKETITGRTVLGAAVIDDIQGLFVLAAVQALVLSAATGTGINIMAIVLKLGLALVFLVGAWFIGPHASKLVFWVMKYIHQKLNPAQKGELALALLGAFVFMTVMALLAELVGLAGIVGAFAAGLVLDEAHVHDLVHREEVEIEEVFYPLSALFVPIFFVGTGAMVDLKAFMSLDVLAFAGVLTIVAFVGKIVSGLAVIGPGADRLAVGLGMIPRGEVGIVFATVGAGIMLNGQKIVDDKAFAAIIVMIAATTIVGPVLLNERLKRLNSRISSAVAAAPPGEGA